MYPNKKWSPYCEHQEKKKKKLKHKQTRKTDHVRFNNFLPYSFIFAHSSLF